MDFLSSTTHSPTEKMLATQLPAKNLTKICGDSNSAMVNCRTSRMCWSYQSTYFSFLLSLLLSPPTSEAALSNESLKPNDSQLLNMFTTMIYFIARM